MNRIIICTYDDLLTPEKKTEYSACWDLKISEDIIVNPGEIVKISAGIKTYMPRGWQCQVYPRSSLPTKCGLMVANNVSIFDADYRGEYIIQLYNFTKDVVNLPKYTRVVQMDFKPYYISSSEYGTIKIPTLEFMTNKDDYDIFDKLFPSERGIGGIGSTGTI